MGHNSIIFAIPRHDYASYRDLYELIRLSNFPTCYIDEVDPDSDNAYIVTILNGESQNGWRKGRAHIVLYDLEYHLDTDGFYRQPFVAPPGVDEVWAGDKWYAEQIGARYVPMGSHPGLRTAGDSTSHERYDIAYIGYINGVHRRERIRQQIVERGVKVSPTVAWGEERHRILSNSTAYLHVHQWDNVPTIAPLRMVVAAAYGLPVITETVADAGMFAGFSAPILECQYRDIAADVEALVHREQKRHLLAYEGQCLYQHLCVDYTFRKSIEAAL